MQLNDLKKQMAVAKGSRLAQLKQKAMMVLKRRKMYDNQMSQIMSQQFNIDSVAFANESIQDTINTVSIQLYLFLLVRCAQVGERSLKSDDEGLRHGLDGRYF